MIVPVRYSIHQKDFDPAIGRCLLISLDGVEQQAVVAYDCEAGWVDRHVLDENGQAQPDPQWRGQYWMERVTGAVTVTLTPPPVQKS
ncbi:hypothetical protein [Sphingobium sp. WCS2017Hpa-17]|uniref:hypothetical protein n=1 Tax=Sphingobium sp. WCS2017Hpa-17 TaxID=3073638 RepID=UPI00288B6008|nr:hypothetical protein [Sphingobium sp. WCS2017Hpa-17]